MVLSGIALTATACPTQPGAPAATSPLTGTFIPATAPLPSEYSDTMTTARICAPAGTSVSVTLSGNEAIGVVAVVDQNGLTAGPNMSKPVATGGGEVSFVPPVPCWQVTLGYLIGHEVHTAPIGYVISWPAP